MPIPTVQKVEIFDENLDSVEDFVNSTDETFTTHTGLTRQTITGVINSAVQRPIVPFDEADAYPDDSLWVEQPPSGGAIYRPKPSALPIAAGPFDPADWVLAQAIDRDYDSVEALATATGVNWSFFLGEKVRVSANNTISNMGAAEYTIWRLSDYRAEVGDGAWVPDGSGAPDYIGVDHYVAGTEYVAIFDGSVITPYQCGCIGDGITNDTAALQKGGDYIAASGKTMNLDLGVYSSSGLTIAGDNWSLVGYGEGVSVLLQRVGGINPLSVSGNRYLVEDIEIDGQGLGNFGVGPDPITMKNGDVGIFVGTSTDATIRGNTIHDCTNLGIGVRTPTAPAFQRRLIIEYNHVYAIGARKTGYLTGGAGGSCIAVGDTANKPSPTIIEPIVRNNICHSSHSTLISMGSCGNFQLVGNTIYDSDSNGIQVGTGTRNGIIHSNHISELTGFGSADVENRGISVEPSGSVEKQISIQGNWIKSAQLYGIDVRVPGMIVSNNIIVDLGDNYQGVAPSGLAGIAIFTGGCVVQGNQIIAPLGNGILAFANNSNLASMIISTNRIQSAGQTGIALNRAVSGSAVFEQPIISSNFITGTTNGSGISVTYANAPTVTDNTVKNANSAGFNIDQTSKCMFDHNTAINSGTHDIRTTATVTNLKFGFSNEYSTTSLAGTYQDLLPVEDLAYRIGSSSRRLDVIYSRVVSPGSGSSVITGGAGSPEGVLTALPGSLYLRSDGGTGTSLYVKETGTGSFGWVAK